MVQETKTLDKASDAPQAKDNLVVLQDNGKEKQVLEINRQMTSLENTIAALNKKLNSTNKQIKADVERLSTSDSSLSEKVASTYKQLDEIESTFKALGQQSDKMTSELKRVNTSLKSFEKESTRALNDALDRQTEINNDFKQQHLDFISRAETLSKKVTGVSTKLNKSIRDNSKAMAELEARLVAELEQISRSSQARDDTLENKIKTSDEEIQRQKAKILLMQGVDEALDRRAASLEAVSADLIAQTGQLKDSTHILDILTRKLSEDVENLEAHTARLAQQNIEQQAEIDSLQDKTSSITRTLLALASLEKKHFRALALISFVLLLALIGTFFYSEYQRDIEQVVEVQRNQAMNSQVAELETKVQDEQMASQVFYSEIIELQKDVTQFQQELQEKTQQVQQEIEDRTQQIKQDMQAMNDEVESIDGRIQYLAPLYNFGTDNTIHGSQWLEKLDPQKMSIRIASVAKKQDMYEIAQRYNRYFTEDLAYFMDDQHRFNLIYGGNFEDDQQIAESMRKMPAYINFEPPASISNAQILQQIRP